MTIGLAVFAFAIALFVSVRTMPPVVRLLLARGVMDTPNQRSSHLVPTPRGGGLVFAIITLPTLALAALTDVELPWARLALGYAALGYCSWRDDHGGVNPAVRLLLQLAVVTVVLSSFSSGSITGLPIPLALDRVLVAVTWIWFINLFNFMDGIDGLAGVETLAVAGGLSILSLAAVTVSVPPWVPASIAGAAVGFLRWNWSPARVFLGDVGSVPLGYVLGFLLILLARDGAQTAALILPLYFLFDASFTLLRRLAGGKKPWQAHREHFYQRAVAAGRSHAAVAFDVALANLALLGLAVGSQSWGWFALIPALACVVILIHRWRKPTT